MTAFMPWPALDPQRVMKAIEPRLLNRRRAHGVTVQDARYRPGRDTWFLYRIETDATPLYVSGRLLAPGEPVSSPDVHLLARYQTWPERGLAEPWFVDRDLGLELFAFPVDPGLPHLFEAADAVTMQDRLARFMPHGRIRNVECRNKSYLPSARATFDYAVNAENGQLTSVRLVGKMLAKKPARDRFDRHEALWRVAGDRLSIPRPLGVIEDAEIALQEHVSGERLGALVDRPDFERLVQEAARQLVRLHELELPNVKERRPIDEARIVARWSDLLRALRPDLASRVTVLEERLTREILRNRPGRSLIHADFHHTNVLVDGDRLTFIDLDELAMGEPMVDVGRFMASLRIPALRAFGSASALEGAAGAFLDAYLHQAKGHRRRARLYESASLLIAAGSAFRLQREHWPEEIELILETAEHLSTDVRREFVNRTGVASTLETTDVQVPHVLRDVYRALADRARGKSIILGPEEPLLARGLRARGCPVVQVPGLLELTRTPETATTILVWRLLETTDEAMGRELLQTVWKRVRPGGRIIVVVPNGGPAETTGRRFSRRSLRHELRILGLPELVTDQPYRWLVMVVRKPGSGPPAVSHTNRSRARITAKFMQGSVIDLGCGEGHLAGLIAEKGHAVVGIDKNRDKIEIAKALYPKVSFTVGDLRKTGLPERSFDTVLLAEVLEHLPEDVGKEAIEAAMRLLKPGGRLVVSVPNEDCVPHRNHLQEFDRRSLRRLLEPHGKTKLVTEQPYKWLLMLVEKP